MTSPREPDNPQPDPAGAAPATDFIARAKLRLRSQFPNQTAVMTGDDLAARLHSCAVRGGRYGLDTEEQVLCYATAGFLLGEDFDADPSHAWAAEILADAELSADERAALVVAIAELLIEEGEEAAGEEAEAGHGQSG